MSFARLAPTSAPGGCTFIVVTEERPLFAKWGSLQKPHEEVRVNEVTHWGHGRHIQLPRLGPDASSDDSSRTGKKVSVVDVGPSRGRPLSNPDHFSFSRPDTEVAKAIRAALEKRQVPHELLQFEERSRQDRTRASRAVMTAKRT